MASRLKLAFLLTSLCLSIHCCFSGSTTTEQQPLEEKIMNSLFDAGYTSMALTLKITLPTLISSFFATSKNPKFTIFAPVDKAFFALKYSRQPPLTLLQYHIAPLKLDKEDIETSLPRGSKIDTLLHNHPLVVTSYGKKGFINTVKIKHWYLFEDEHVVVHGVEDFFDPAYQTLMYPLHEEDERVDNDSKNNNLVFEILDDGLIMGIVVFACIIFLVSFMFV